MAKARLKLYEGHAQDVIPGPVILTGHSNCENFGPFVLGEPNNYETRRYLEARKTINRMLELEQYSWAISIISPIVVNSEKAAIELTSRLQPTIKCGLVTNPTVVIPKYKMGFERYLEFRNLDEYDPEALIKAITDLPQFDGLMLPNSPKLRKKQLLENIKEY